MKEDGIRIKPFHIKKGIRKTVKARESMGRWSIVSGGKTLEWTNSLERVKLIRYGVPASSVETIGQKLNRPVKTVLTLMGLPQTTYNKKKSEESLLDSRNSELIILITELIDFGKEVFNNEEEKFQRWLRKPNQSLAGNTPESLLDTVSGIEEVKYCLHRLEYGNLA